MQPFAGRVEQVGRVVVDGRVGIALPGEPDGCLGDVERDDMEAEPGDVFSVGPWPQPTTTALRPDPLMPCSAAHRVSSRCGSVRVQGNSTSPAAPAR
jgi:hypothetical protein